MRVRVRCFAAVLPLLALAACGKKRAEVKAVDEHEGEGASSCFALPQYVDREITIGERCALVIDRKVLVRAKGKLVIGAGTKIAFGKYAALFVDGGGLIVRGREDAPVLFTSHAPSPAPGDWYGVRLNEVKGASLSWTTIEYAGSEAAPPSPSTSASASASASVAGPIVLGAEPDLPHEERAALVAYSGCGDLVLDHLHVVHSAHGGASLRGEVLARMSASTFEWNGGFSVETIGDEVPALAGNSFGEPARVFGAVTKSATWPADVPLVVEGTLIVGSTAGAALTLASASTLRFAKDAQLQIGASPTEPGTLSAREVRFTPEGESPKPGDWGGFDLTFSSAATILDGCAVDHAGAGTSPYAWMPPLPGVPAAIVRPPRSGRVVIRDTTFRDGDAPAFSGTNDCDGYEAAKLHNVSVGKPLCATAPVAPIGFLISAPEEPLPTFGSVLDGLPLDAGSSD